MKTLFLFLAVLLTGCAALSDPRDYIKQLPDAGFENFVYNRNTGPSSATITAKNAIKDGDGYSIDILEVTENFTFGSIYIKLENFWIESLKP